MDTTATFPTRSPEVIESTRKRARKLKSRNDWLVHFRKAKTDKTLTHMAERILRTIDSGVPDQVNMWLAYGDRQDEIEQGKYTRITRLSS